MMQDEPLFLKNPEWYETPEEGYFDDGRGYHLTDKAPQEAIDSYNEFYGPIEWLDDDGNSMVPDGWTVVA